MDANVVTIVVAIVAAAPGIFAVWRQAKIDKQKKPIEELSAGVEISSSAAKALETYSKEVFALREELAKVRVEMEVIRKERAVDKSLIDEWRLGISRLIAQLASHDLVPVWTPTEKRNTGPLSLKKE